MRGRAIATAACLTALLLAPSAAAPAGGPARWQAWKHVPRVVDLAGPRADGRLVVSAGGRLWLLRPSGALTAYPASGAPYRGNPGLEPYLALAARRQRVPGAGCAFARGTIFALVPRGEHPGVVTVSAAGQVRRLASVSGVTLLTGIVLDTAGRFGSQLLVTGVTADHHGVVAAIDCRGRVRVLTRAAPHLEGGLAIAPPGLGGRAGDLLAPDELDGRLLAIAPDGQVRDLVDPGQPAGGDIGVESIGVVPSPLRSAYLADRRTPGNRNPGHDLVLRLAAGQLAAAGVAPGDLLVTLEGGGATIAVRCDPACSAREVATAPSGAHAEGKIAFAP